MYKKNKKYFLNVDKQQKPNDKKQVSTKMVFFLLKSKMYVNLSSNSISPNSIALGNV